MTEQVPGPARRALFAMWLGVAVVSVALLAVIQLFQGTSDDPDPAYQRPGLLDLAALPAPAPAVTPQLPQSGRPAVVFFERPDRLAPLCAALPGTGLTAGAMLVVVTSGPVTECGAVPVVADPAGRIAQGYGMRTPIDGGPPVGYAVVDATGSIRYRTLAPDISELREVSVMLGAL